MAQDTFFNKKKSLNCSGRLLDLSTPVVMGILNITPDSFYDGGNYSNEKEMLMHAEKMLNEGASIIDIGAQSTRPGATLLAAADELTRLLPALRQLRKSFPGAIFSVDTFYSQVAKAAVHEGADSINDISGGTMDAGMFDTVAQLQVPYMLMHIQGTPQNMQKEPHYIDVVKEVFDYFVHRIQQLRQKGVHDIIIDPGFGFGKTVEHNYALLNHLPLFQTLGCPIMAGISRKSLIHKVLNIKAAEALNGTTVLNTVAILKRATLLRVHDVKAAAEAIKLTRAISN